MEDSPLSITANIAGILTFVAAIFASIYVRYVSLRNGRVEMETIWNAAKDSMDDLEMMDAHRSFRDIEGNLEHLRIKEGDESDIVWLKRLGASLMATEIVIYVYCARSLNIDTANVEHLLLSTQCVGITSETFSDAAQEIRETSRVKKNSIIGRLYGGEQILDLSRWTYLDILAVAPQIVLAIGSSPSLIRWSRVRERALKRVRGREILRSRLLSHQVSMANSAARQSNKIIRQVANLQMHLDERFEDLNQSVKMVLDVLAKQQRIDGCGNTADERSVASLDHQESSHLPVNSEVAGD